MYQSKLSISTKTKQQLKKKLSIFLKSNNFTYCKTLKRRINLSKLPDIILNRKNSHFRLKRFFIAIDILKKEKNFTKRVRKKWNEYEVIWLDKNWIEIFIHIREENNRHKDKELFFISCY